MIFYGKHTKIISTASPMIYSGTWAKYRDRITNNLRQHLTISKSKRCKFVDVVDMGFLSRLNISAHKETAHTFGCFK